MYGHVAPYKSEADLKVHNYIVVENKKNMQRKGRGYANRDIQSGITFDRKIIFMYCKRLYS